jgi:hypothetical protein
MPPPKRALSTNLSLTGSGKTSVSRLTTLLESCPAAVLVQDMWWPEVNFNH